MTPGDKLRMRLAKQQLEREAHVVKTQTRIDREERQKKQCLRKLKYENQSKLLEDTSNGNPCIILGERFMIEAIDMKDEKKSIICMNFNVGTSTQPKWLRMISHYVDYKDESQITMIKGCEDQNVLNAFSSHTNVNLTPNALLPHKTVKKMDN